MKAKKVLSVVLATSMILCNNLVVLAESAAEGTGTYEGGEMKYPTLSVELPTIPAGTYDYIADPNGLIAATSAAAHGGEDEAVFTGTSGIFFQTSAKTDTDPASYTNTSAALSVTNENAQDIDVTVKLEQKTAGSEIIQYSDTATFEETDEANKLYLAVTDNAETDAQVEALSATAAAVVKVTVAGVAENYEASWTEEDGYLYALVDEADLTDWNSCSFSLTGALNTNATWGDEVTFPEIKVTWSYAEHSDAPVVTPSSMSTSVKSATISGLADGATLASAKVVKTDGTNTALTSGTHYTYTNDVFAIKSGKEALLNSTNYTKFVLTYSDGTEVEIPIVAAS